MEDLRVRRTKASIIGAFIDLVEEKGFDNVKIIDICSKAMINRNTFYLHYLDKEDLLQKIINSIFIEQQEKIMHLKKERNYNNFESAKEGFMVVLEIFKKEIEFYRIVLLDSNMSGYMDKSTNKFKQGLARVYEIDYDKYKVEIDYIFYSIVGVIKNWIIKDYSSVDNISTILANMTINSLKNSIKKEANQ